MQIRVQEDMKTNIAKVKASYKEGFRAINIRSFHSETDTGNPASHFTDEVEIAVPYMGDKGQKLVGYCNVKHAGDDKPLRINTVELWTVESDGHTKDRNYEDVFMSEHPDARSIIIKDKEGNPVSFAEAESKISDCAAATVQFPHVMHFDEYMDFQTRNFERLKFDPPTSENYIHYLETCKGMMKNGGLPYVGAVTDADSVDMFKNEIPTEKEEAMKFAPENSNDYLP